MEFMVRDRSKRGRFPCSRRNIRYWEIARLAVMLCLLCALLPACSLFSKQEPERELLEQRTGVFIDLGWSWLHAENVRLLRGSWQGERYLAVFAYDIVIDAAVESLPAFEQERFSTFLPMCAEQGREKGARCQILETVAFINSEAYGWMPELALRLKPEQLAFISREKARGSK